MQLTVAVHIFGFLFVIRSLLTTTSWSSATEDANVWKSALACIYTPKDNRRWKCIRIFGVVVVVVVGMCGRCAKTRPCHYFTFQRGDTRNLGAAPTTTKDFKFVTRGDNRKLCAVDDKIIKLIIYELVAYNCKCVNMCLTSLNSVMSDVPGITTSINTQLLLPIYLSINSGVCCSEFRFVWSWCLLKIKNYVTF